MRLKISSDSHSHRVVALPAAGTYPAPARPGTGAQLGPGAPAAIVAHGLLAGHPDAVALKTPLKKKTTHRKENMCFFPFHRMNWLDKNKKIIFNWVIIRYCNIVSTGKL